jgi:hypothetical protein
VTEKSSSCTRYLVWKVQKKDVYIQAFIDLVSRSFLYQNVIVTKFASVSYSVSQILNQVGNIFVRYISIRSCNL